MGHFDQCLTVVEHPGMRPSGLLARTSIRLPKPESGRCSNGMSYILSVIATRRVNGDRLPQ
jgi:hypothetical protein